MHGGDVTNVDQRLAAPHGDAVGRDKIQHFAARRTQVDGWLELLADERRTDTFTRDFVENLSYFFNPSPDDEIVGLEAKLKFAGRESQIRKALRKKEAFSKLLDEWKSFPAAQEIFAYFLSRIDLVFESEIKPLLGVSPPEHIDKLFIDLIVIPILDEMGCGPFMLNYTNVSGMIYWLAEQCYTRWHA